MTDSDDQHIWQSICIRHSGHWPNISTVLVCTDGTLSVYYWPDGVYIASGSDCQCNLPFISDEAFQTLRNVCGRADARAQWDELVSIAMED